MMLIDTLIWSRVRATVRPDGVMVTLFRARYGRKLVACGDSVHLFTPDDSEAAQALYERLAAVGGERRAA